MHSKATKFESMRDVPDMTDKIALVTGGNSGIGYETVKVLFAKGATVYLAARSPSKGKEAIAQLEGEVTGQGKGKLVFLELDLSDLRSVRKASEEFLSKEKRLDLLFNNAGVMIPPTEQLTAQGYDLQFGTNTLGHYFFTELLLPALTASHAHTSQPARVIHTTSDAHTGAAKREVLFDSLKDGPKRNALIKKWGRLKAPWTLYGSSKLGNIVVSNHYSSTQPPDVLVSCSLHPGLIQTGLQRNGPGIMKFITGLAFSPAPVGAYTQLWAGTFAAPEAVNGKYFVPVGVETAPKGRTDDKELASEISERQRWEGALWRTTMLSWWVPEPTTRGTYAIISSCALTLFLCVWTAIHVNIPEHAARKRHLLRKVGWLLLGLFFPELVTFIAWNQYLQARNLVASLSPPTPKTPLWKKVKVAWRWIASKLSLGSSESKAEKTDEEAMPMTNMNDEVQEPVPPSNQESKKSKSWWKSIRGFPVSLWRLIFAARTTKSADWTLVHGFYTVMGGFALDLSSESTVHQPFFFPLDSDRLTLTPNGLRFLLAHAPECVPRVTSEDIQDKSKADLLTKLISLMQAAWFCLQCIARAAQHLSVSPLEVTTGGHALYTLVTYVLWSKKPKDITLPNTIKVGDNQKLRQLCAYMYTCSYLSRLSLSIMAGDRLRDFSAFGLEEPVLSVECNIISIQTKTPELPPVAEGSSAAVGAPQAVEDTPSAFGDDATVAITLSKGEYFPNTSLQFQFVNPITFRDQWNRTRQATLVWEALLSNPSLDLVPCDYVVERAPNVPTFFPEDASLQMILGFVVAEALYALIHASAWNTLV
ncbi:hypothetical protein MIND_00287500 [Mycena indigotica]|uniref:NAD(P)-binding protein n=1 Tax=Mycena indigotica TaxID=2126181 RepID=A0A8H6T898_9AGAR|nr:uncharacterized protein MIND_00287500 [Mycena indigotica]KAF7312726.1 hypothetical protein MIND_00287500 [Mycena indigotica]